MYNKELYFAINKNTKEIFNTGWCGYKNKVSWVELSHLKAIFTRHNIDKKDYNFYKIFVENGAPVLDKVEIL